MVGALTFFNVVARNVDLKGQNEAHKRGIQLGFEHTSKAADVKTCLLKGFNYLLAQLVLQDWYFHRIFARLHKRYYIVNIDSILFLNQYSLRIIYDFQQRISCLVN